MQMSRGRRAVELEFEEQEDVVKKQQGEQNKNTTK